MDIPPTVSQARGRNDFIGWWRVLRISVMLYILGLLALVMTGNPTIFPTVVLIGNFMVPVTFVAFFYDRRHLSRLTFPDTAKSFFLGGILGILAAAILEPLFIARLDMLTVFEVGIIEEAAKILGVFIVARSLRHTSEINGIILGAAAGMGFAALESTGYAFDAFLRSGGDLSVTVGVTLLRGILSPVGHGTWTAILASVLFRESAPGRFRINDKVWKAFFTVVFLHGMWDALPGLINAFVLSGLDYLLAQLLIGGTGLYILWRRWREAVRLQQAQFERLKQEENNSQQDE